MRVLAICLACLCLSGCDVLRLLLPHRATTDAEVVHAMEQCRVAADSIAWKVTEDGAFAFGRKSPYARPMPQPKNDCLTEWAKHNRVEVRFIAWEINDP